jgi:CRP-like cAMP-binding protein
VPRHQLASVHELARIGLFAELPGQTLGKLAERMERSDLAPGETVLRQGEASERFFVVLGGMLSVRQETRGERGTLGPGDYFGEVGIVMDVARTATVTALTPATVASCNRATFDELIRPLFTQE